MRVTLMNREMKEKKIKKFTGKMQAKLLFVFFVLLLALVGLIVRLVYLNNTDGERYAKRVLSQQTYSSTIIPYQRGSIYDRKGTVLATSEKVYNLVLDVKMLLSEEKYYKPTMKALTDCYPDITSDSINNIIDTKPASRYTILLKKLSYNEMMTFKKKEEKDSNIKGVWFEGDYARKYPYNNLACDVIGFTTDGNIGNWGLEQYYNEELNGINGREYGYIDAELKLERTIKPAKNGNTIVSTIDANVQGIVQNKIKEFYKDMDCENIGVLIMNPNNGEILAMASNRDYDLNNPTDLTPFYTTSEITAMSEQQKMDALNAIWRNYTISNTYEPGSTCKPFTVSMGLEENVISEKSTYVCDGGQDVAGTYIGCSHTHGTITLAQSLALSCNDAMMQIVSKEGRTLFYQYQNFFGFGHKTGIDLPGEEVGILVPEKNLNATELATSSFGQTFTATMVQVASGYSSLVNGGNYYQPHIVKQIINAQGTVVKNVDKVLIRKTVSDKTSEFIKKALSLTITEGTGKKAAVAGYSMAGKTGTAEQGYPRGSGNYLVSFIGNVSATNPDVVIYVIVDRPNVAKQDDNSYATLLTKKILTEVLPFLEIYSTEDTNSTESTTVPVLPSTSTVDDSLNSADINSTDSTIEENTTTEENNTTENTSEENTTEGNTLDENTTGDNN